MAASRAGAAQAASAAKNDTQEGDLFRGVTVTTKEFSFTAKAVRVTDDGKVVTFAIVD